MTDVVKIQLEWLEIQQGEPSKVHTAAHIFKGLGYEYRDQVSYLTYKFNVDLRDVLTSISYSWLVNDRQMFIIEAIIF